LAESHVALGEVGPRCPHPMDQQHPQIFVALFADPELLWPAACRCLTQDKCRQITALFGAIAALRIEPQP
jgi:hypothetical protein